MAAALESGEAINSLLLVKAVLAALAVLLFIYYKYYWEKAKRHLAVHFFYAKWKTARHSLALGVAAAGFAAGFSIELFGSQIGLSPGWARAASSGFEILSLFSMLYVFFSLALEDVPHFLHISEHHAHRHPNHHAHAQEQKAKGKKNRGKGGD